MEAPGTFHHCLMVAQLAGSCGRGHRRQSHRMPVAAYYHDIGKVQNPLYFIENIMDGPNPHGELTPSMSARIIIDHVSDGVEMARANNLPRPLVDAIEQHHGTSLAYFFYRKALQYRDEILSRVESGLASPMMFGSGGIQLPLQGRIRRARRRASSAWRTLWKALRVPWAGFPARKCRKRWMNCSSKEWWTVIWMTADSPLRPQENPEQFYSNAEKHPSQPHCVSFPSPQSGSKNRKKRGSVRAGK